MSEIRAEIRRCIQERERAVVKATRFEFRYRLTIGFFIYLLGFWAPWIHYGPYARRSTSTWLELSGALASTHALTLQYATLLVTILAILFAAIGAALRVWGTACLGSGIVQSGAMHAENVVAAGPYRYLRNPLYLGSLVFSLAVSILMPPTGAIFFVIAVFMQMLRLILGEEAYLAAQRGESYLAYKARVPRLIPSLFPRVPSSPVQQRWLHAVLAETYPVTMTLCFAVLAWRYNALLLTQAVVICFGLSLVIRAFLKQP
jgi:protein-S-isoprenylcysteine O-methyltransferase Ste14